VLLRARAVAGAVATAALCVLAAGCGGGDDGAAARAAKSTIPHSLRVVESGSEDTTDFILGGHRAQAIRSARALDAAARGPAAADLAKAGVAPARIAELERRAAALTRIVAHGEPIDVALAANRAFELVPAFFAVYRDRVPSDVTRMDYYDFEAKLQSLAGHRAGVSRAVRGLEGVWGALRDHVVTAGGKAAAGRFDAHVAAMQSLLRARATSRALAREAQHGLDLVDEVEEVYEG
jgi:hypothetical protein